MRRRAFSLSNNAWEAGGVTNLSGKIQKKKAHTAKEENSFWCVLFWCKTMAFRRMT